MTGRDIFVDTCRDTIQQCRKKRRIWVVNENFWKGTQAPSSAVQFQCRIGVTEKHRVGNKGLK